MHFDKFDNESWTILSALESKKIYDFPGKSWTFLSLWRSTSRTFPRHNNLFFGIKILSFRDCGRAKKSFTFREKIKHVRALQKANESSTIHEILVTMWGVVAKSYAGENDNVADGDDDGDDDKEQ